MIDDELKSIANSVLHSAYYLELQALVAKYRAAGAGLGSDMETGQGQVKMHNWGDNIDGSLVEHEDLDIWTDWLTHSPIFGEGHRGSCGHTTMLDAFEDERADRIGVEGRIVFERRDGGWHWVGDE